VCVKGLFGDIRSESFVTSVLFY